MADNTASNIAQNIANKAAGNPVAKTVEKAPETTPVDPNAGKEKYVVDGKEIYLSPEQAKAYVQKGIAFEPKVSQLGRLQQETQAFLKTLQEDPAKVLYNEKFGQPHEVLDRLLNSTKVSDQIKEKIGQWYFKNVVEQERLSPEQREAAEMKRRVQEYEAMENERKAESMRQEEQVRVERAIQVLKGQINEAMKEAGIPLDHKAAPGIARRVAQIMKLANDRGMTVTPKDAMAKAKAEVIEYQRAYYDSLDEDKLVEQIGKDNAEKVRKYFLKQVKDEKKEVKNSFKAPKRDERKTMSSDEFRDYLSQLKKQNK